MCVEDAKRQGNTTQRKKRKRERERQRPECKRNKRGKKDERRKNNFAQHTPIELNPIFQFCVLYVVSCAAAWSMRIRSQMKREKDCILLLPKEKKRRYLYYMLYYVGLCLNECVLCKLIVQFWHSLSFNKAAEFILYGISCCVVPFLSFYFERNIYIWI